MSGTRILIVDDEASQRSLLAGFLSKKKFEVTEAENGEDALAKYREVFSPLALVDMKMPGMSGVELIVRLKEINPHIQIIMLTAFGSVESAVSAMRAGAYDYLTKPVEDLEELLLKLQRAAQQNRLVLDVQALQARLAETLPDTEIIGKSEPVLKLKEMIATVAPGDATVLITGESGTGKELVAQAIHAYSPRTESRLVAINCAAFPETLLESELFGHEKGAFTGASKAKQGRFELADGGTLFLDEVGETPPTMQVKLLRVLEERAIERLGSTSQIKLDFRLIAATNRKIEEMIKQGKFREDLYYRLNVIRIDVPPLRERGGDVILLAESFLARFARKIGKDIKGFAPEATALLSSYDWPGNVRELENVVERAAVLCRGEAITAAELSGLKGSSGGDSPSAAVTLAEVEKGHIRSSLELNQWSIAKTAEILGIHRNTLRAKIKEYSLKKPE